MKIIVASHGDLCNGLIHSYSMLAGDNDYLVPISLKENDTGQFKKNLEKLLEVNDDFLILCDLYGGTPFNEALYFFQKYPDRIRVVAGVNLPMLLELGFTVQTNNEINIDELVNIAINVGSESLRAEDIDTLSEKEEQESDDMF